MLVVFFVYHSCSYIYIVVSCAQNRFEQAKREMFGDNEEMRKHVKKEFLKWFCFLDWTPEHYEEILNWKIVSLLSYSQIHISCSTQRL